MHGGRRIQGALLALALAAGAAPAAAEVVAVGANGFIVKQQRDIAAPPAEVYRVFVEQFGRWWNPAHSWSGDGANFSLDARPGGCLCEKLPDGGGSMHMMVGYVEPGSVMRLVGGLGPLQLMGLSGTLNVLFDAAGSGTRFTFEYRVSGFDPQGFDKLAPLVDGVLGEQASRLELLIETGAPAPPAATH